MPIDSLGAPLCTWRYETTAGGHKSWQRQDARMPCWEEGRLKAHHKVEWADSIELEQSCLKPEHDRVESIGNTKKSTTGEKNKQETGDLYKRA